MSGSSLNYLNINTEITKLKDALIVILWFMHESILKKCGKVEA